MNWEIQLARPLRTHRCGLPAIVRTLGDAVDLIDEDLPETLRFRPAWREVKEMLVAAAETRTGRAVETATTLLERVLEDEGWLDWGLLNRPSVQLLPWLTAGPQSFGFLGNLLACSLIVRCLTNLLFFRPKHSLSTCFDRQECRAPSSASAPAGMRASMR